MTMTDWNPLLREQFEMPYWRDLLAQLRGPLGLGKRALPVLVMTGDGNREKQSELLREGANDLVLKPIEERLLVTKVLFQLRVSRLPEQRDFAG